MLDDFDNKCNNTLKLHLILMLNTMRILTKKILNLRLLIVSNYQNTEIFLLKDTHKTGQKKFLSLIKLKTLFCGPMLLVTFYEK